MSCPAEQDLFELVRTSVHKSQDRLRDNVFQGRVLRALFTEFGRHNQSVKPRTMAPTRQEILAASAGWVAVTLNVLPGLGAGYLYQLPMKSNTFWTPETDFL